MPDTQTPPRPSRRRERLFVVLVLLSTVGLCELVLRAVVTRQGTVETLLGKPWYYLVPLDLPREMPSVVPGPGAYRVYDADLGWTLGPLGKSEPLYFSDPNGRRCSRQTYERLLTAPALEPGSGSTVDPDDAVDIVTLGDSFTHGDEVPFEDAWPTLLSKQTGLSVLNLGVGGYGIDQAVLRYEKTPVEARLVLLGLIAGDLERAQTQIYNIIRGGLKTKPLFTFDDASDPIVNRPAIHGEALRRELALGGAGTLLNRERIHGPLLYEPRPWDAIYLLRVPYSLWVSARYRPAPIFATPGPNHDISIDILQYGRRLATSRGADFLVVLLGNNNTFALRSDMPDPWSLLKQSLDQAGIAWVDTSPTTFAAYREDPHQVINATGVHYTPAANRKVADQLTSHPAIVGLTP